MATVGWVTYLRGLFHHSHTDKVTEHLEQIDQRNREVRHDLKNVQTRTDALARLIESMREEERPRWEGDGGNGNGKRPRS